MENPSEPELTETPSVASGEATKKQRKLKGNWKDPEWRRKYYREKRREYHPLKRHPNILDDGTKWSTHNPYGKFETKEEKLENDKKYRKYTERTVCEVCGKDYNVKLHQKHLKSRHHRSALFVVDFQYKKVMSGKNTLEGN